jgi:hypothetical protein
MPQANLPLCTLLEMQADDAAFRVAIRTEAARPGVAAPMLLDVLPPGRADHQVPCRHAAEASAPGDAILL